MRRGASLSGCAALLAGILLTSCATEIAAEPALPGAIGLSVQQIPLSAQDASETKVGRLLFRGGLVVRSPDKRFGGWSGLAISADGKHLLSQSDEAHWLKADLIYDARGNLAGLTHGQLADMRDTGGTVMAGKEGDAEGLALLTPDIDGPAAVSFERNHRIWAYDLAKGLDAKATPVAAPDAIKALAFNSALESLVLLNPATLLAIAEEPQAPGGDIPAWLIPVPGSSGGKFEALTVKPHAPYEISDAAISPDGKHLYLLERHYFDLVRGVIIAVRDVDASTIKPGAQLDGEEIAAFTLRENIDNMEGIATRRGAKGETLLYLLSDDNYSPLQRTLLLMFELQ